MRLPLAVPIMSRDGTLDKGSKLVNVYTENKGGRTMVYSRPGISTAANTLAGYGNGIFGPIGLSTATQTSTATQGADANVLYTFVDGTFARTYATGGISTLNSVGMNTFTPVFTTGQPFFFKGEYYIHQFSTFAKRASLDDPDTGWNVVTTSAPMVLSGNGPYKAPFEYNGNMYLWKPYGETGGGTDPYMTQSADGTTWSTIEMSSAITFFSGTSVDFYNIVVTKFAPQTVWWINTKEGYFTWNSTGIFPPTIATSSRWHQLAQIDPAISTAATGKEQIVTDSVNFYMALENSTYSIPVPYGITSTAQSYQSSWTVLNSNTGFGSTSTQALGYYRGKFVLATGNSSHSIWISEDFVNWTRASANISTTVSSYFTDAADAMLAQSTSVYHFSNYEPAYSSSQATIGSINNPNNVPIDLVYQT